MVPWGNKLNGKFDDKHITNKIIMDINIKLA